MNLSNKEAQMLAGIADTETRFWVEAVIKVRDEQFYARASAEAFYRTRYVESEERRDKLQNSYNALAKKYEQLKMGEKS